MYTIIGADGKEYGPITADQVRQWITDRRATAQTLARPEGTTEWKQLGSFPEFSLLFGPPALTAPPVTGEQKSKLAAGLLGIFLGGIGVHRFYLGFTTIGVVQILVTFITCGVGALWGFIEGILIIAGTTITADADGRPLKE